MIAMLFIIVALVFDSHTLFVRTLPSDMGHTAKEITAWGMAIAFELTVLLATANSNYVHKSIQYFLAFCTLMTTLFFFDVFGEADTAKVFRIVFVSVMIACINFIYAELFVKKWQEYQDSISAGDELIKSFSQLKTQLFEADNKCSALQESKIIVEQNLLKHQQLVSELEYQVSINEQKIKVNEQVNQTLQSELNTLKSKLSRKREISTAINNG